jgi:hypothetical protein
VLLVSGGKGGGDVCACVCMCVCACEPLTHPIHGPPIHPSRPNQPQVYVDWRTGIFIFSSIVMVKVPNPNIVNSTMPMVAASTIG